MDYVVSTVRFVDKHRKQPKGQGFWMFEKKMVDGNYLQIGVSGTYLQAKRYVIKEFSKDPGYSRVIYLLP